MNNNVSSTVCAGLLVCGVVSSANAAVIVSADSINASHTFSSSYSADNLINQSGLSTNYVSGVTDFDAYTAGDPRDTGNTTNDDWSAPGNVTGVTLDFSFDNTYAFESLALWNRGTQQFGQAFNNQILDFQLFSATDNTFSNLTLIGNFTADRSLGTVLNTGVEVFGFSPVEAANLRMFLTLPGDAYLLSASEMAFEGTAVSAVPVPAAIWLFGSGLIGLAGIARRKA
jgi:hypothetical protein